jgi:hypothetical protein
MSKRLITTAALVAAIVFPLSAFAQGGGGGGGAGGAGGGSGGAAGSASGGTAGLSGSAGTGSTSTGIGASPGASSVNTTSQTNRAVSPANPSTTAPGGPNSQPVPNQTVQEQNPQQFDPRLSPGYQK